MDKFRAGRKSGFTLVEALIVCAILAIIVAVAVGSLRRATPPSSTPVPVETTATATPEGPASRPALVDVVPLKGGPNMAEDARDAIVGWQRAHPGYRIQAVATVPYGGENSSIVAVVITAYPFEPAAK